MKCSGGICIIMTVKSVRARINVRKFVNTEMIVNYIMDAKEGVVRRRPIGHFIVFG